MTKMKKLVAVGLAGLIAVTAAACSNGAGKGDSDADNSAAVKTGLGIVSEIQDVTDTTLTIDSVAAAVTVDADGKILDVKIDEAQTKPDLAADAGNVTDLRTKLEKQDDYAMKPASPIGKEWYEQVAAYEAWAKGKTVDEINAGADATGAPTDADLSAGCTINVNGFASAISKAVANAADLGASAADTLKIAVSTEKYYESNETNLQYDSNYAAVTVDADGKVTSCLIDASQAKCTIADGKFTVAAGSFDSKKELKDSYNMKPASPIGKEWYEQAAAFETWAKGKNADEIKAGAGTDGKSADADLSAGCTIIVSSIVANAAKAAAV
ncbi:MAG: hypothetical protein NC213_05745 [Acetobacter sp.]|nr:hypothetical protein [Bacteroides sp.]MCM1341231.1 hypothetical protein [Acetobacter sp.]MCM1433874.1 hypothetical protein [Clostridiales bacterium]